MITGIAQLPGFAESLRLLVEREQYTLTDIGMMFGVSRERMRQLCARAGLVPPPASSLGLHGVRVWDDGANQFRPVRRGDLASEATVKRAVARKRATECRVTNRRASIVAAIAALRRQLAREPSWRELAGALGVNAGTRAQALIVGRWRAFGETSQAAHASLRAATGYQPPDTRGSARRGFRLETCKRGHQRSGANLSKRGYCITCRRARENLRNATIKAEKRGAAS